MVDNAYIIPKELEISEIHCFTQISATRSSPQISAIRICAIHVDSCTTRKQVSTTA